MRGAVPLLCAGLLALVAQASLAAGAPGSDRPTRVVLITLDTLRYDRLDAGEDGPAAMPLTRERASRGLRFTRFYAASTVTQPSHASLFTGLHPWEHGMTRNGLVLSESPPVVAELFRRAGFETRAVVASFPVASRFGFGRGFDEFTEEFSRRFQEKRNVWEKEWQVPGGQFFAPANEVTDRSIEALERSSAPRQFFWFHFFDAHSPYGSSQGHTLTRPDVLRPERRDGASVEEALERARRFYALDVAFLDRELDRLLRRLESDGDRFETHVFVVADHGESLGEGGSLGHGFRLSEEQLRVPAFILSPQVTPGLRTDVAASIDVPRTLLSLAGVSTAALPPGGRDLLRGVDAGARAFAMRKTFAEGRGRELRLDGRFYEVEGVLFCEVAADGAIQRGDGEGLELEGAAAGPSERRAREETLARFRTFQSALNGSGETPAIDPEVRRGLEALGYVD